MAGQRDCRRRAEGFVESGKAFRSAEGDAMAVVVMIVAS